MADPSVLLSSIVGASATLVAIIGGLLVSRAIALSAEYDGLSRRSRELTAIIKDRQAQYDDVRATRLAVSRAEFFRSHIGGFVEGRGKVDISDVLLDHIPIGSTIEEVRAMATFLAEGVKKAFNDIEARFVSPMRPPEQVEALERAGITIPPGMEDIYSEVAKALLSRRPAVSPSEFEVGFTGKDLSAQKDNVVQSADAVQAERVRIEGALREEADEIGRELDTVNRELRLFGRPKGVILAMSVLSYFSVVGIVVPLALLGSRPVTDSLAERRLVLALCLSGLFALLGYLWYVALRSATE